MWVHHHTIFRLARRPDAPLLFANGFLLLMVVLVPFPTAVVSDYLSSPVARSACFFYSSIFVVLALSFRRETMQQLRRSYRLGPPGYLLAALAALVSAWLSLAIVTVLWVFWAVVAVRSEPCEG
jgi:uncharacterized membrane protein